MKKLTPKELVALTAVGLLTLPFTGAALTVRTDHRSSSGGITVSEGSATATGDQNSSVSVQNVISGSRGRVEVTTTKDGVTTTETREINGNGSVQVVTPTPQENEPSGRTPRAERGVVAASHVSVSNDARSSASVSITTAPAGSPGVVRTTNKAMVKTPTKYKTTSQGATLAMASKAHVATPYIVSDLHISDTQASAGLSSSISGFIARIFSMFGFNS